MSIITNEKKLKTNIRAVKYSNKDVDRVIKSNDIYWEYDGPKENYLTFTALDQSSVGLESVTGTNIQYSVNGGGWQNYGDIAISLSVGDNVRFRGYNIKTIGNCYHFVITNKVAASGDLTSLTNGVGGDCELTEDCYQNMFYKCYDLVTPPNLPSTKLAKGCYKYMFFGCSNLEYAPKLPATELPEYCYDSMFFACTNLTWSPDLPAETVNTSSYEDMFYKSGLMRTPKIAAKHIGDCGMLRTFYSNSKLKFLSEFKPVSIGDEGAWALFEGCGQLNAVETTDDDATLDFTELTSVSSYNWGRDMLRDTKNFIEVSVGSKYKVQDTQELTFMTVNNAKLVFNYVSGTNVQYRHNDSNWYDYTQGETMWLDNGTSLSFRGNNIITDESNHFEISSCLFPKTKGLVYAYGDVTSLTNGVGGDCELSDGCYDSMFKDCTLIAAPNLPSTSLANNCYHEMFSGCSELRYIPELPANVMKDGCYKSMFENCSLIDVSEADSASDRITWDFTDVVEADDWNARMITNTAGVQQVSAGKKYKLNS